MEKQENFLTSQICVKFVVPSMPNFIKDSEGKSWDVSKLPEETLKFIGSAWSLSLLKHAHNRREMQKNLSDE